MDLPQQVLDAAIVELVAPVTVLIQLTHLAHEEVRYLKRRGTCGNISDCYIFMLRNMFIIAMNLTYLGFCGAFRRINKIRGICDTILKGNLNKIIKNL